MLSMFINKREKLGSDYSSSSTENNNKMHTHTHLCTYTYVFGRKKLASLASTLPAAFALHKQFVNAMTTKLGSAFLFKNLFTYRLRTV